MKKVFLISFLHVSTSLLLAQQSEAKLEELMSYKGDSKSVSLDYNPFVSMSEMGELTSHATTSTNDTNEFVLLSVMNQKAYISGKWYSVGDKTSGGKILNISPLGVELNQNGKKRVLRFEASKKVLHVKDSSK